MKTLYDSEGKPHTFTHSVDAREALQSGILRPYPPGELAPIPTDEKIGYNLMTKSDLVALAFSKHDAALDVNDKKPVLIAQLEELDRMKASPPVEEEELEPENEESKEVNMKRR